MREFVADERVPVSYDPQFREYSLPLSGGSALQEIEYCPWCGADLPSSLRDAFFERMEELGVDYPFETPSEEFLDDTWWRSENPPPSS